MTDAAPHARISENCWEAAVAVATGDHERVRSLVDTLHTMRPEGLALRLAATGWAVMVADYLVTANGLCSFSASVEGEDEATEVFAAVVCAIGNHDAVGALSLLRDSEPSVCYEAAMQLLGAAGAALAAAGHSTPGSA